MCAYCAVRSSLHISWECLRWRRPEKYRLAVRTEETIVSLTSLPNNRDCEHVQAHPFIYGVRCPCADDGEYLKVQTNLTHI